MKTNKKRVAVLLLAAGGSSRMGHAKQLIKLNNASLIKRAAQSALQSQCDQLYVVVGAQGETIRKELEGMDLNIVLNPEWGKGIGSSIHAGIKAIKTDINSFDAVLILLVDQPAINDTLLNGFIKKFEEGSALIASYYADTIGVPALFSKVYFDDLEKLTDDRGAKGLLQRHAAEVTQIPFPDGAFDVDTPTDLEKIKNRHF